MKYKKQLIILIISTILYIVLSAIYNNVVVKSKEQVVYVLKEDITKGEKINIDKLQKITLKNNELDESYNINLVNLANTVANINLYSEQILTNTVLIDENKYIKSDNKEEIVSIKLKTSEDSISYNISKDSLVNIYYTGKTDNANKILENVNDINVISGGEPGYISVKLFSNIKVIGVYDKYGNEINVNDKRENNEVVIDTILISTDSKMAMTIYNLQKYGEFSLSLIK